MPISCLKKTKQKVSCFCICLNSIQFYVEGFPLKLENPPNSCKYAERQTSKENVDFCDYFQQNKMHRNIDIHY